MANVNRLEITQKECAQTGVSLNWNLSGFAGASSEATVTQAGTVGDHLETEIQIAMSE